MTINEFKQDQNWEPNLDLGRVEGNYKRKKELE